MRKMNRAKQFRKNIAAYEKKQVSILKYLKEEYALDSGCAEIYLDVRAAELYNPLSVGVQRELSSDIYSYMDEKAYPVPTGIPLKAILIGVPREERPQVSAMIRGHYDLQLRDKKLDLRINRMKSIAMFTMGFVLLALYFVLASFISSEVWYEILSIVATFIVWEAADDVILARHDLKMQYYYTAQMALMEIEFSDE